MEAPELGELGKALFWWNMDNISGWANDILNTTTIVTTTTAVPVEPGAIVSFFNSQSILFLEVVRRSGMGFAANIWLFFLWILQAIKTWLLNRRRGVLLVARLAVLAPVVFFRELWFNVYLSSHYIKGVSRKGGDSTATRKRQYAWWNRIWKRAKNRANGVVTGISSFVSNSFGSKGGTSRETTDALEQLIISEEETNDKKQRERSASDSNYCFSLHRCKFVAPKHPLGAPSDCQ
ncbi:hypothetical protein B0T19DRAFT_98571 [Cercophora scortea]|uniref:Uncharacterized protein n=1 Tax=Cercophora scortea TaxID=314031 RepID=A0AAE0IVU0_9PEZI|nr:hypothetical protein B0T19DRAFT_98571 [Cercophora scortea]